MWVPQPQSLVLNHGRSGMQVHTGRAAQPRSPGSGCTLRCRIGRTSLVCLNSHLHCPPKAEDRPEAVVVRLYEAHGSTVVAWLQTSLPVKEAML